MDTPQPPDDRGGPPGPAGPHGASWQQPGGPAGPPGAPWPYPHPPQPPQPPRLPQPSPWSATAPVTPGWPGAPLPAGGLAIASFVTALVCLFPLALTLGLVALGRLADAGAGVARARRDKALAITGVALAGAQILTLAVVIPVVVIRGEDAGRGAIAEDGRPGRDGRDERGGSGDADESTGPGDGEREGQDGPGPSADEGGPGPEGDQDPSEEIGVYEIEVGDCFDSGTGLEEFEEDQSTPESTVTRLGCDAAHEAEAFGTAQVTGYRKFPGDAELTRLAYEECGRLVQPYVLDTWTLDPSVTFFFYYPQRAGWAFGDREILCFFGNQDGSPLEASLRGDPDTLGEEQHQYLELTTPLEITIWNEPLPDAGLARHQRWAGEMSRIITEEVAALAAASWSPEVAGLVEELVAAREESVTHWDQASSAPDRAAYDAQYAQGYATLGVETEITIRQTMGLATTG